MGAVTRRFQEKVDSIVTECYVYAPTDFCQGRPIKRVKIMRSLWDTGASVSLISVRVAKALGLTTVGKSVVSGYNEGVDFKETFLVHFGLPTGDIVTNIMAMGFESDEYDVVIGMDVICNGDLAITNKDDKTTFSFRIPAEQEIDFSEK